MADWRNIAAKAALLVAGQPGLTIEAIWQGRTIHGVKSQIRRADVETDAGLIGGRYTFSLLCPFGDFPERKPAPRVDKVFIGGQAYRVLATTADSINATIRLDLGDILA